MKSLIKLVTIDCWDTILINDREWDEKINLSIVNFITTNFPKVSKEKILKSITFEEKEYSHNLRKNYVTDTCRQRVISIFNKCSIKYSFESIVELESIIGKLILNPIPKVSPGAFEFLSEIKNSGINMCLICNTGWFSSNAIKEVLKIQNIDMLLDEMIFSDEFGKAKPSIEIFSKATSKFHVKPKEAIHIGDSVEKDYIGAKGAGLMSLLYTGIIPQPNKSSLSYDNYKDILDYIKSGDHCSS